MKLSFCTNGIDARLEDLGDERAGRVGLDLALPAPSSLVAVRRRLSGGKAHSASASSSSVTPTPVLAETQTIGNQRALRRRPRRSAAPALRRVGCCPFEVALRHVVVDFDDRLDQRRRGCRPDRSARRSRSSGGLSVLTTPLKSCAVADRHVERNAGVAEQSPECCSSSAGKSTLSASILLMTIIRPRPGLAGFLKHAARVDLDAASGR